MRQERRNITLLFSLLFLTACLIALFLFAKSGPTTIDKTIFRVVDQTQIDRVETESLTNGKIILKFDGAQWKINDSLLADRQMVKVFFATLLQAVPKRKFSEVNSDSIKRNEVRVKLFEGDQLKKEFVVSGNSSKGETYFTSIEDGSSYVMTIPGYRVYIASIFKLSANEWRDKRLFNFNWQNFKNLTTTFPEDPAQNFTISFTGHYFGVEGMAQMDTTRVNDFLDAVSLVQADRYLTPAEGTVYEELMTQAPNFQIEVRDIANRTYSLQVFVSTRDQKLVGKMNGRDLIYLNSRAFASLQRKKNYFVAR